MTAEAPVPLGEDEVVVLAEGPTDLPERLRDTPSVRGIHPDSDFEYFGTESTAGTPESAERS